MSVIEISHLGKYYGKSLGIKDVSFSVEKGEIFGFVGPNGAGKSTTLKILLNFIYPTGGSASILGKDVVRDSTAIKAFTSYVPSDVRFYGEMRVRELMRATCAFYRISPEKEIQRLYKLFEIEPNKRFSELSLGNKKKVAIMSALLSEPKVLILDEPTNGLDPLMQKRLFEELRQRTKKGATVLLSSHNLTEIQESCTRVAFIKAGSILSVESLSEKVRLQKVITLWGGDGRALEKAGAVLAQKKSDRSVYRFSGESAALADALAKAKPADFTVENVSLEDQFMSLYEGGAKK